MSQQSGIGRKSRNSISAEQLMGKRKAAPSMHFCSSRTLVWVVSEDDRLGETRDDGCS